MTSYMVLINAWSLYPQGDKVKQLVVEQQETQTRIDKAVESGNE